MQWLSEKDVDLPSKSTVDAGITPGYRQVQSALAPAQRSALPTLCFSNKVEMPHCCCPHDMYTIMSGSDLSRTWSYYCAQS